MGILINAGNGTPIDVTYINQIVDEVNNLNKVVASSAASSRVPQSGKSKPTEKISTANLSVVAGKIKVTTDDNSKTADVKPFTFDFGKTFKYEPICSATPEITSTGSGLAGSNASVTVIITKITTSNVSGKLVFNSDAKQTNVLINIIAVGIPAGID